MPFNIPAVDDITRPVDTTSVKIFIKTGCFYHHAQTSPIPFRRKGKICATEYQMPNRTHELSNIESPRDSVFECYGENYQTGWTVLVMRCI